MDLQLEGKHVFITGASQGLGRSAALAFAKEGAQISVAARNEKNLKKLMAELCPGDHGYVAIDLLQAKAPTDTIEEITAKHGEVDIVVHAVGGSMQIENPYASLDDWALVWRFNIGIAIEINSWLIPRMKQRSWGRVIHLSSRVAVEYFGPPAYNAAKSYLNTYVTSMGRILAPDNVIISAVMPSAIAADDNGWCKFVKNDPDKVQDFLDRHQSIGRLGTADDITPFLLLLASDRNSFAAGSIISVDGGSK